MDPISRAKERTLQKYVEELINKGDAYYAFDTPEELESLRKTYESRVRNLCIMLL